MTRNATLDVTKILLALSVIGIHTRFLKDIDPKLSYILVNGIFRAAVPVFFLINGYYLWGAVQSGHRDRILVWAKKLGCIYFAWSLIYLYWMVKEATGSSLAITITKNAIVGYWHLWYMPALILSGLLLYITKNTSSRSLILLASVLYSTGVLFQYIGNYQILSSQVGAVFAKAPVYRNFLFDGFPFLIAGALVRKHDVCVREKISARTTVGFFLIAVILVVMEARHNYLVLGYKAGFDMLLSLPALALFWFLLAKRSTKRWDSRLVTDISAAIYFLHPLLILFAESRRLAETSLTLLVAALSMPAALVVIMLNKRIKVLL